MRTITPNYFMLLFILLGCSNDSFQQQEIEITQTQLVNYLSEPIRPLTNPIMGTDKIRLGELLFHDPRLSADQSLSCASCHSLDKGGVDQVPFSVGMKGKKWQVNAPSVLNAAHNFRQFWDGKAATLDDQIEEAVQNEDGMGTDWEHIVQALSEVPGYVSQFRKVYHDDISATYIKDALIAFQKSLASPSRFDDFLLGDRNAISMDEKVGYLKFKEYGCTTCHQGINVGGNMFQKMGVVGDYFKDRGDIKPADYGRYNLTGKESDKFVFKVPSLRNVALTAPYFHDGSVNDLKTAIQLMGTYQLGKSVSNHDAALIALFLRSLTGKKYQTDGYEAATVSSLHISENIKY